MAGNNSADFIGRMSDRELLRKRAEELAKEVASADEYSNAGRSVRDYVSFRMGDGVYGIETSYVKEVVEQEQIVSVPCTPEYLAGVVSVRGKIWAVIDLFRFWGKGVAYNQGESRILLLQEGENELAFVITDILEVVPIPKHEHKKIAKERDVIAHYAYGITKDRMILLDGSTLLQEPSLVVNEFVGTI